VGVDQGISFAVMEFLDGETLRDRLVRGVFSLGHVLEIGAAVADGLATAHAHGIIHRDLKPANIFLTATGQVKILDFGLARITSARPLAQTADYLTEIGQVMGTARYMSPEQARGDIPDARSDIFSLGCVLYEMATGRCAFPGDTAIEVMAAVLRDEPAELDEASSRLAPELRQLLAQCLAKQPAKRFQSAGDVALALKMLQRGEVERGPALASRPTARPCVAVLPFQNLSANKLETEFIADGMTESLIAELAKNRCLRVVSRTTVMQFKDTRKPLRQIARELQADALVEGSAVLAGQSVRITAQLIRADTDEHLWAETYQRVASDVLVLHSEVAEAVAQEIKLVMFDEVYRSESRSVLATLIRLLGDFDLAEEATHAAFAAAVEEWPGDGIIPARGSFLRGDSRQSSRSVAELSWTSRFEMWCAGSKKSRVQRQGQTNKASKTTACD
jgi:TolB-like protein